jgi:hypothetical protein
VLLQLRKEIVQALVPTSTAFQAVILEASEDVADLRCDASSARGNVPGEFRNANEHK